MIDTFLATLLTQLQQQSLLEAVAVCVSVLYPWLAARENILCWPVALLSTSLYVYIFWEVSLPFNSFLNAYYLVMAVYGWHQWRQGRDSSTTQSGTKSTLPISVYPLMHHMLAVPILLISGFVLAHLVTFSWQGSGLYLDALVTVFSVYTTYLMANKKLENWLYWLVINSFAAYLYMSHGLILTSMLHIAYFVLAVYGYWQWKQEYRAYNPAATTPLI